jgi:hypothetical protein
MRRLVVFVACPLLVGFAPAPGARTLKDPDQAVSQFDRQVCAADGCPEDSLVRRKQHLVRRLEDLQDDLARRGRADESAVVRDLGVLANSLSASHRLGENKPAAVLRQGSVEGKYSRLLHVLHAPADQGMYNSFQEFGFWNGTLYAGQDNLKPGHWVYVYPRWFIWQEGPKQP